MIIITSNRDGFRRCGVAHTKDPVAYEDGFFSEAQLAKLAAEPMLTIMEGGDPEASDGLNREADLVAACGQLDKDNPDHFTKGGVPQTAALEELSGYATVSAAERDTIWDLFCANQAD